MQNLATVGSKGAWLRMRQIRRRLFFSLRTATGPQVKSTNAANGSNEAS